MSNPPTETSVRSTGTSLDDRLEAMGRLERRWLLLQLSAAGSGDDPTVDLGELASGTDEMHPLVAMRHLHLPVLEERGFVRWDRGTDRVTRGSQFDELEPFLELFREIRDDAPPLD